MKIIPLIKIEKCLENFNINYFGNQYKMFLKPDQNLNWIIIWVTVQYGLTGSNLVQYFFKYRNLNVKLANMKHN